MRDVVGLTRRTLLQRFLDPPRFRFFAFNPNHDERGRFADSPGGGRDDDSTKKWTPHSDLSFAQKMFKDMAARGIPTYGALVFDITPQQGPREFMEDLRGKMSGLGYKEVGATSMDDEDNPAVKWGGELNFEHADGRALNVYMRGTQTQLAVTCDEDRMETAQEQRDRGAPVGMHTSPNRVPAFVRRMYESGMTAV